MKLKDLETASNMNRESSLAKLRAEAQLLANIINKEVKEEINKPQGLLTGGGSDYVFETKRRKIDTISGLDRITHLRICDINLGEVEKWIDVPEGFRAVILWKKNYQDGFEYMMVFFRKN